MDDITGRHARMLTEANWWTPSGCKIGPAPPERHDFSRLLSQAELERVALSWDVALAGAGYKALSTEEIDCEDAPGVVGVDLYQAVSSRRLWLVVRAVNLNKVAGDVHVDAEHVVAFQTADAARRARNAAGKGGWSVHETSTGDTRFVLPVPAGYVVCTIDPSTVKKGGGNRVPVEIGFFAGP